MKPIDQDYFKHYAGNDYSYDEMYRWHSGIDMCLDLCRWAIPEVRTVFVLGCATGKVLQDFEQAGVKAYGCEISPWAYEQIPEPLKQRVICADMREVIPVLASKDKHFDLIFSNSFVYLPEQDIEPMLRLCSHICKYIHFFSSFEGAACADEYRETLKPYVWWGEKFRATGFNQYMDTYLWKMMHTC